MTPRYPALLEINTRVWLADLSRLLGRPATLDDIPDTELERFASLGFDWIWMLSVWQTGPKSRQVSRSNPEWRKEFQETLPELRDEDIAGCGFALSDNTIGGTKANLEREPSNDARIRSAGVDRILAHARDPYFPGWPDTLQL